MIGSIIEIALGYFIIYYVPGILNVQKGIQSTLIRLVGFLLILGGIINLIRFILFI